MAAPPVCSIFRSRNRKPHLEKHHVWNLWSPSKKMDNPVCVALIRFNRPKVLNAPNDALAEALAACSPRLTLILQCM